MDRVLQNSNAWYKTEHSGSINNRIRKAYFSLRGFIETGNMYFKILCDSIFAIIAIVYFSPVYGLVAVVLGIISISINLKFDKPYVKALQHNNELEHKLMANLTDNISNIRTIFTLRMEKVIHKEILSHLKNIFPPFYKAVVVTEWRWFTVHMMVSLTYLVVIVGYVYEHYTPGAIFYVGSLVALIGYVNHFTNTFYSVTIYYTDVLRFKTDVQSVKNIEALVSDKKQMIADQKYAAWNMLNVSDLSFTFKKNIHFNVSNIEANKKNLKGLHQINISLRRHQKIALIGESGAGKSTLLALLRGIYTPDRYALKIDDQDDHQWSSLSDMVSLLPQDAEIFENTIKYNITLGLPYSDREIARACELTCFNEVVQKLPNGINSVVNEKGVNLSGGEKQRLALTRGILNCTDSSILLLDEPTSSLDKITAHKVYANIMGHLSDKTIICSLHNHEYLKYFTYLYHVNEGRIVWNGTSADYLASQSLPVN